MRKLNAIYCLSILLSIFSFSSSTANSECEILEDTVIKAFFHKTYTAFTNRYFTSGNVITETNYFSGNPKSVEKYVYNQENEIKSYEKIEFAPDKKVTQVISSYDNKTEATTYYKYDSLRNLVLRNEIGHIGTKWYYKTDKNPIKSVNKFSYSNYEYQKGKRIRTILRSKFDTIRVITSFLNEAGKLEKEITVEHGYGARAKKKTMVNEYLFNSIGYDSLQQFYYLLNNNERIITSEFETLYSNCGLQKMLISKSPMMKNDTTHISYMLTDKNLNTRQLTMFQPNKNKSVYSFDDYGNWIKISYFNDETFIGRTVRVINYY